MMCVNMRCLLHPLGCLGLVTHPGDDTELSLMCIQRVSGVSPECIRGVADTGAAILSTLPKPRSRHSPVYLWLQGNRQHMAREIARHGMDWTALAARLAQAGVLDRTGQPPRAGTVKQAWYRVRRKVAVGKASAKPVAPVARPGEIAPGVRRVNDDAPDGRQREKPRIVLTPAVFKRPTPADGT